MLQPESDGTRSAMVLRLWSRYPGAVVTLAATLLAVLLTMPLSLHLNDQIYGGPGDATGTVAIFWWWAYAVKHGQPLLNNTLLGVPIGSGWDQIPFMVLQVAVFVPLSVLIGSIAAYNLGILSSYSLTAWATFQLGRTVGMSALGAAFAALAFAFVPLHTEKAMGHLMEAHMEVFPAFFVFALRWAQGGSRWNLLGAGAMAGLTLWTDIYYAMILATAGLAFFVVNSFLDSGRDGSLGQRILRQLGAAGVIAALASVFIVPALYLLHRPGTGSYSSSVAGEFTTFGRTLEAVIVYSARPHEYLLPWRQNPLLPETLRQYEISHLHLSNFTEQSLFVGYTVLVLAAVGALFSRRKYLVVLFLALGFTGFFMAQQPFPHYGPVTLIGPSYYLHQVVPIFRVYARFGLLVLFGAALLAGLGIGVLQLRLGSGRSRWLLALPFLLLAVEFNNMPPTHTFQVLPGPAEYHWLHDQPPGVLVEYPLAAGPEAVQEIHTRQYTLYQQVHEHPMFNGAPPTSPAGAIAEQLEPYYGPGVSAHLSTLGVRYVFVHRADYLEVGQRVPRDVDGMSYLRSFGDTDVFLVPVSRSALLSLNVSAVGGVHTCRDGPDGLAAEAASRDTDRIKAATSGGGSGLDHPPTILSRPAPAAPEPVSGPKRLPC